MALELSPWAPESDYGDAKDQTPEQPPGSGVDIDTFGMELWTPVPASTFGRQTTFKSHIRWTPDNVVDEVEQESESKDGSGRTAADKMSEDDRWSIAADLSNKARWHDGAGYSEVDG